MEKGLSDDGALCVRVRMALSVVKANNLLIRGSRERQRPRRPYISDRFAMYDWQTGSEW